MNLEDVDHLLSTIQTGLRTLRILTYYECNVERSIEDLFKSWNVFLTELDNILYPGRTVVLPITDEVESTALAKLGYPNGATREQLAEAFYGKAPKGCLIERSSEPPCAIFLFDSKDDATDFKLRWGRQVL